MQQKKTFKSTDKKMFTDSNFLSEKIRPLSLNF